MNSNIVYLIRDRGVNSRFLANISFDYPDKYKVIENFFGFTFTKTSYNCFLKGNQLRGFNNSFNVFLCPWEERSLIDNIKSLKVNEKIKIDALIVNGRLLNIYEDITRIYLYNILDNFKLPFYNFQIYISFFLSSFLNYHIKVLILQLNLILKIKNEIK